MTRVREALRVFALLVVVSLAAGLWAGADPRKAKSGVWEPQGLSGGGAMFAPAISPADPKRMLVHCDMSAAYRSEDGGRTWMMIHHAQLGGNTRCRPGWHPKDPNVVYSAHGWDGKLRVSRDAGRTFTDLGDLSNLRGEIGIDPERPTFLLTGVGEEVWRSVDGGSRWDRCEGPEGEALGFAFGVLGKSRRLAFAATSRGVWRSEDGGGTWVRKYRGLPEAELLAFAGGFDAKGRTGMLYVSVPARNEGGRHAGGVFASRDAGETWASAMGEGINRDVKAADAWSMGEVAQYPRLLATHARPLTVWALNTNTGVYPPHHTAAFRSDDGGRSWRATFFPDPRFGGAYNLERDYVAAMDGQYYQGSPNGAAICASDPDRIVVVDNGNCVITTDGGKTWFNGHTRESRQQEFFECTGLVVTTVHHYYVDPFEPRRRYIAYTDIGFARSLDEGRTWRWWGKDEKAPWRNTCYEIAFDPDIPGKSWGAFSNIHDIPNGNIISGRHGSEGPGGVCASTDFGEHWKPSNQGLPEAPCTSICVAPKGRPGARTLYCTVFGHGVFKSVDDGRTWTEKSRGLGDPVNRRAFRVQAHADGTLFCVITALRRDGRWVEEGVGLYRSRDGGENWQKITDPPPTWWLKDFTVDPLDSRVIWLSAADTGGDRPGGLFRTQDGGKSWKKIAQKGPEHWGAYLSPHRKGWVYMTLCEGAPEEGLWLSRDDGATWTPFRDLPFKNVQRVEFDPKDPASIYLATFGGSVWKGPAEPR